jgi:hypothetical protein
LYFSPNITRVINAIGMRWIGHAERMEDRADAYSVLAVKADGKGLLRRPKIRWESMIEMNLQEL